MPHGTTSPPTAPDGFRGAPRPADGSPPRAATVGRPRPVAPFASSAGRRSPAPPPSCQRPTRPTRPVRPVRICRPVTLARRLLPVTLVLLLAGLALCTQQVRPAPYGDHLTPGPAARTARAHGAVVEAYDGRTLRWRYARAGRRPLSVLPARGHAIAVWDDGLVTDTDGRSVRWHRALPAATGWLRRQGGTGVLRPLGRGVLGVVTPARIAAYRTADGDLRWVLPARAGCAFRPERAVRHGPALLVAQPCADGAWTAQLIAVDDLGRIVPHRAPLGNERPRIRPEHPRTEKALAPPR
ncbi:hypothetical protein [Streptomyces sp. NPDC059224]|uniref:hypothetical protein n=1 Tax=Streptomyces sp. NPDC059224 TaxID=3346775 RepID=UPI0036CB4BB7